MTHPTKDYQGEINSMLFVWLLIITLGLFTAAVGSKQKHRALQEQIDALRAEQVEEK